MRSCINQTKEIQFYVLTILAIMPTGGKGRDISHEMELNANIKTR